MLDKLVDNAASFCPEKGNIEITLSNHKNTLQLSVANDGPLLPDKMQGQLFDNMVSLRDEKSRNSSNNSNKTNKTNKTNNSHLGLGLHIVNLIVKFHNAQITADNRNANNGVIFSISFQ
jgi:K+-sensing histidine kinase KdpD